MSDKAPDDAAEMLTFLLLQFRLVPGMLGRQCWLLHVGWPMTCAVGDTIEDAIRAAMAAERKVGRPDAGSEP